MANILTSLRILCGLSLWFCPAFSGPYYFFCLFGGFNDAIDGWVARKLGKATRFGAKLDTAADIVFMLSMIGRAAANAHFPKWALVWIGAIVLIKSASIGIGAFRYREFVTVHSIPNKICGAAVFAYLLLIGADFPVPVKTAMTIAVCALATAAAIRESAAVCCGKLHDTPEPSEKTNGGLDEHFFQN